MRVGREQALLSPCRSEPLARAVALAAGGDDPQEMSLQEALRALGLEWQLLEAGRPGEAAAGADVARARERTIPTTWLAGDEGGARMARRRATQLRMLGLATEGAQEGDARPRAVARFAAAAAGE
eukprot:5637597-Pleurochrysis_carterae.AAC.1